MMEIVGSFFFTSLFPSLQDKHELTRWVKLASVKNHFCADLWIFLNLNSSAVVAEWTMTLTAKSLNDDSTTVPGFWLHSFHGGRNDTHQLSLFYS